MGTQQKDTTAEEALPGKQSISVSEAPVSNLGAYLGHFQH